MPGAVDGNRLLGEDVLARRDRRSEVIRPEARRRRQDHDVAVGREHAPVGVESAEAVRVGDGRPRRVELHQVRTALLEAIGEDVAERDDPHIRRSLERIVRGAGSATPAADHADGEGLLAAARGPRERGHDQRHGACRGARDEEATAKRSFRGMRAIGHVWLLERQGGRSAIAPASRVRVDVVVGGIRRSGCARHRDHRLGQRSPLERGGTKHLLGLHELIPGDQLPGVGRVAPHDRHEGALHHEVAVVERLAVANRLEELRVLDVVHVRRRAGVGPLLAAVGRLDAGRARGPAVDEGEPLGARDPVGVVVGAVGLLTAREEAPRTVVVLVDRGEVVEDVATLRARSVAAAAEGDAAQRRLVVLRPVELVDAVAGLLDDDVAREPVEVPPVLELELHVAPVGLASLHTERTAVVGRVRRDDVADLAVEDLAVDRALGRAVAPAEARHERQALLLGGLRGRHRLLRAGHVGRHRLLGEDVLARGDRLLELLGTEARRRREDHHVDVGREQLVDRVEADELAFLGDEHAFGIGVLLELRDRATDAIGEDVRHRPDDDARIGVEGVRRRTGAPATAADETDLDPIIRLQATPDWGHERQRRDRGGGADEAATVDGSGGLFAHGCFSLGGGMKMSRSGNAAATPSANAVTFQRLRGSRRVRGIR